MGGDSEDLDLQGRYLSDVYLGLPLGAKYQSIGVWDSLLEKFRSRLALWKRRYLSKGGHLVLIKSTLQSLPVFMLSCRLISVTVLEEIEKIIRRFFFGHDGRQEKISYNSFRGCVLAF